LSQAAALKLRPIGQHDYPVLEGEKPVGRIRYAKERTPRTSVWQVRWIWPAAFQWARRRISTTRSVDMSAWGWIDRTSRAMKGSADPLAPFPNIKRWLAAVDARPAAGRTRAVGKDHGFEETKRKLFPSNYPATDG
jgi:hypothetical protein